MRGLRRARKTSKLREVYAPSDDLKEIQRKIGKAITRRFEPHPIAHAYTRGRNIITNAQTHLGARIMLHIDLVDFFGSISEAMVTDALRVVFDGVAAQDIAAIADLCCRDGFLPQGSPASPIISNLVCISLDAQVAKIAHSLGCSPSRYSDDVGISSPVAYFAPELASLRNGRVELGPALISIIEGCGFRINWSKVRLETQCRGLKATGLNIGKRVTVPRRYRNIIRAALHRWEKEGLEIAARRGCATRSAERFVNSLSGSIAFVGQVMGRDSLSYRRLVDDFQTLARRDLA